MNDYNTAKEYLASLKNELLTGQVESVKHPEPAKVLPPKENLYKSMIAQLSNENKQLKGQVLKLQEELNVLREAKEDVVNKLNLEIENLKGTLKEEKSNNNICPKNNGLYVSLDSILEWAAEQHKDQKEVTLIQNMIYDRFELTKKGKELVRKLDVNGLRQIIIQHADQVIGIAENNSNVVHTKTT